MICFWSLNGLSKNAWLFSNRYWNVHVYDNRLIRNNTFKPQYVHLNRHKSYAFFYCFMVSYIGVNHFNKRYTSKIIWQVLRLYCVDGIIYPYSVGRSKQHGVSACLCWLFIHLYPYKCRTPLLKRDVFLSKNVNKINTLLLYFVTFTCNFIIFTLQYHVNCHTLLSG